MNNMSKELELIITIFGGAIGLHKFLKGDIKMGLIYLFTGGLFGIGVIMDVINLLKDKPKQPIQYTQQQQQQQSYNNYPPTADPAIIRDFHSKVVGVSFNNDDGSSRQEIIRNSIIDEDLYFKPMFTAEYPNAIGVFNHRGQQLGHLTDKLASEIKTMYPQNIIAAKLCNITGGNGYPYGANLHILIFALGTSPQKASILTEKYCYEMVCFNKGSKVYHSDLMCAGDPYAEQISEKEAKARGLRPCQKCCKY